MNEAAARKRAPFLTFTCPSCNVEVSITDKSNNGRTINGINCPICRTFYALKFYVQPMSTLTLALLATDSTQPIVGTINPAWEAAKQHSDVLNLLFAMRYVCNCVAPIPDGEWCGYCKRLLPEED